MSSSSPIHSILNSAQYRAFHVPPYQRDYSWDKTQFWELWEDVNDLEITSSPTSGKTLLNKHFIGLLVLIRKEGKDGEGAYDIVDWQQRLTTIMILLATIRDHFVALRQSLVDADAQSYQQRIFERILQINQSIFIDAAGDKKIRKFIPNENDLDFFEMVTFNIDGEDSDATPDVRTEQYKQTFQINSPYVIKTDYAKSRYDGRIVRWKKAFKAYEFFYKTIETELFKLSSTKDKIAHLEALKLRISEWLEVMVFASDNDSDAFNLFETLNDRWLELASIDLVRNKLLQTLPHERRKDAALMLDETFWSQWDLFWVNPNSFLKYYYSSRKSYITKSELYPRWKQWISSLSSDHRGIFELLEDIKSAGKSYSDFSKASHQDPALAELFTILGKTQSIQWYSVGFPIMKVFNKFGSNIGVRRKTYDAFWLLANITIRFILREERFNHLEKEFPKLAQRLDKAADMGQESALKELNAVIDDISKLIDEKVPDFTLDEIDTLISKDYGSNNLATALLRIYLAVNVVPHGTFLGDLTLEHVCPESHARAWSSHNEFADEIKYKIGNFLLVTGTFNPHLWNASFEEKRDEYVRVKVADIPDLDVNYASFKEQGEWDREIVLARSERFVRWSAPGGALWVVSILHKREMPFAKE